MVQATDPGKLNQIHWRRVPGKCLYNLLRCPPGRGIESYVEMDNSSTVMAEDYQYVQNPVGGRPGPLRRDLNFQNSLKPSRCHRMTVSGFR